MKEEDYILRKVGTENSFRVPEGYFEGKQQYSPFPGAV